MGLWFRITLRTQLFSIGVGKIDLCLTAVKSALYVSKTVENMGIIDKLFRNLCEEKMGGLHNETVLSNKMHIS